MIFSTFSLFLTAEDYARLCHYQDIIDLMRSAPSIATWDAGNMVVFHTKISCLFEKTVYWNCYRKVRTNQTCKIGFNIIRWQGEIMQHRSLQT